MYETDLSKTKLPFNSCLWRVSFCLHRPGLLSLISVPLGPSGPEVQSQASTRSDGIVLSPETVWQLTEKKTKKKRLSSDRPPKGDRAIALSNSFEPLEVDMSDEETET